MSMPDDPRIQPTPVPEDQPTPTTPEVEESEDEAEEQPDTETEESSEAEPSASPPRQPQGQSDEARRRARDREKIERLENENKELRKRSAFQIGDVNAEVERRIGAPPKEADYRGDYLEYDRDLTAYKLDRRIVERQVRMEAQNHEVLRHQQMREAAETHFDRVSEFKERTPDYDQVMQQAQAAGLKVSNVVEDLLIESEHSAQLQYYFAKHPDALDQVNQMTERQAARAIGNLEAQISVPQRRNNQQTRAPAPFRPLSGGAAPPSQDRDLDAYISRKYGKRP